MLVSEGFTGEYERRAKFSRKTKDDQLEENLIIINNIFLYTRLIKGIS